MNTLGIEFVDDDFWPEQRLLAGQHIGGVLGSVALVNDELHLKFDDGTLVISDQGQSCCESRYMTCDDNLAEFSDSYFMGLRLKTYEKVKQQPDEDGYISSDDHEVQWLEVMTSKGFITFATHNEHNGYYGGFDIDITFEQGE